MGRVLEFVHGVKTAPDGTTTQPREGRNWKLSPSDFAFLWEECHRCFYLKVVSGFQRPRSIMPKIFTLIDSEMKTALAGRNTCEIAPNLPAGALEYGDRWIESQPIVVPGVASNCFVRGKLDGVIQFKDGRSGFQDFPDEGRTHCALFKTTARLCLGLGASCGTCALSETNQ